MNERPALRPLTLFLKYFLNCRLLNETFTGGIGSFMLQMMILSHLQVWRALEVVFPPDANLSPARHNRCIRRERRAGAA